MSREYIDKFLNKGEIAKLEKLAEDKELQSALRKVLLSVVYAHGTLQKDKDPKPLTNFALNLVSKEGEHSDEKIGSTLRALWSGVNIIESGFEKLEEFKVNKPENEGKEEGIPDHR